MRNGPKSPTPSSKWKAAGEPDPHGDRYAVQRSELTMGDLTDDELANGAFLNYDQPLNPQGILAGTHSSPIAWMTAVKDRIRWLSRALDEATTAREGYVLVPVEPTGEMREAFHRSYERYEDGHGECPDSQWAAMLKAVAREV